MPTKPWGIWPFTCPSGASHLVPRGSFISFYSNWKPQLSATPPSPQIHHTLCVSMCAQPQLPTPFPPNRPLLGSRTQVPLPPTQAPTSRFFHMNLPSWQPKGYSCNEIWPHSCICSSYNIPFHSHTRSFTVGTPLPASQPNKLPSTGCPSVIHRNPGRTGTSKASDQAVLPSMPRPPHPPIQPHCVLKTLLSSGPV